MYIKGEMKMNKKLFGLTSLCAVAVLAIMVVGLSTMKPAEQTYQPGNVPPAMPLLDQVGGQSVTDALEATNVVGYKVDFPKYLPNDYKVQVAKADDKTGVVIILASKVAITPQTLDQDFMWKEGGITIYSTQVPDGFDKDKDISNALNGTIPWKPLSINGGKAAGHEIISSIQDGETISSQAELVFYKDNTRIFVYGMQPLEELIKIGESF